MSGQDFHQQFIAPSADENAFKVLSQADVLNLRGSADWDPWS